METNNDLKGWDNYCSTKFLKAQDVKDFGDIKSTWFTINKVANHSDENEVTKQVTNQVRLFLSVTDEEFQFDLNKTNSNFLRDNKIDHPKDLLGKKIRFDIVQAFSPKEKKYVDSLRIAEIK